MFDVKQLLNQYLGGQSGNSDAGPGNSGNLGGLAGGALAGGLMGLLAGTKTGRNIGKNVLAYGGTAVLGGLAYKAWRDWQNGRPVSPQSSGAEPPPMPPPDSPFLPQPGQEAALDRALIRAMIGAAKADGRIDEGERQRIFGQLEKLGLDTATTAFVHQEMAAPLDLERIVADAVCPETAAEIYAASLLVIDPERPAEKGYLSLLGARLGLEPGLIEHLRANVAQSLSPVS